jgi:hypothetical protein
MLDPNAPLEVWQKYGFAGFLIFCISALVVAIVVLFRMMRADAKEMIRQHHTEGQTALDKFSSTLKSLSDSYERSDKNRGEVFERTLTRIEAENHNTINELLSSFKILREEVAHNSRRMEAIERRARFAEDDEA